MQTEKQNRMPFSKRKYCARKHEVVEGDCCSLARELGHTLETAAGCCLKLNGIFIRSSVNLRTKPNVSMVGGLCRGIWSIICSRTRKYSSIKAKRRPTIYC